MEIIPSYTSDTVLKGKYLTERFTDIRKFPHCNYEITVSYRIFSPSQMLTTIMLALSSIIQKLDFAASEVTHTVGPLVPVHYIPNSFQ